MASFLNTDLGDLYNSWGERVAFNDGYQRQKIASARSAGAAAFVDGLDPDIARENYLQTRVFENDLVSLDGLDVGGVEDLGDVDDMGAVDDLVVTEFSTDSSGVVVEAYSGDVDRWELEGYSLDEIRSAGWKI